MKKLLSIISLLLLVSSCEVINEKNLYDEDDSNFADVLAKASSKCLSSSNLINELESVAEDFTAYYTENAYYKITRSPGSDSPWYVKITDLSSNSVKINVYRVGGTHNSYTYTVDEHNDLKDGISGGLCDYREDYQFKLTSGTLDSTSEVTFTDTRFLDDDDDYPKEVDTYKLEVKKPLAFILLSGWKRSRTVKSGDDTSTTTSSRTLESITQAECQADSECNTAELSNWSFTPASFNINPAAYTSNDLDSLVIEDI